MNEIIDRSGMIDQAVRKMHDLGVRNQRNNRGGLRGEKTSRFKLRA